MRKAKLKRTYQMMGNDIVICVENEEGSHIGTSVMAIPYQRDGKTHVTCQVINQVAHKEEDVAKLYASEISILTNHVVCCICGIHLDDITQEEMMYILKWCRDDVNHLKKEFQK